MKYIWEEGDIYSGVLTRNNNDTEMWLIGYLADRSQPCLVSMCDGMIQKFVSRQELADHLNKSGKTPVLDYCQAEVYIRRGKGYNLPIRKD